MTDLPAHEPSPKTPPSRLTALFWITLYLGLSCVLVFGMVYGLRMRCEGFGCMGVGVYWFAWACVYAAACLMGLRARWCSRRTGVAQGLVHTAVWVQLLMGLALLFIWWRTT